MSIINDPTRLLFPLMKLTAFSNAEMTKLEGTLLLPYDATSMDSNYKNHICDNDTLDQQNGNNDFKGSSSSDLQVTFILDDSTYSNIVAFALPNMLIPDNVDNMVKALIKLCHTPNSENSPNYILLKPLNMPLVDSPGGGFKGRLVSMTIKNELITLTGSRVKAKAECTFKESLSAAQNENTLSSSVKKG
jgi:hypothetical protein